MAKNNGVAVREKTAFPSSRGRGVHIAPSLLAADFTDLRGSLDAAKASALRWIHFDIMDGHFVPNISFGPLVVESLRPVDRDLYFDVHLMIDNPRPYVKVFHAAGAQLVTFHVEAAGDDTANLLKYIKRMGMHAGLSLRPKTPIRDIEPYLDICDLVLVMTVEPGFGGQKMIPATLNKVRELVHLREEKGLSYLIQVDGGINADTASLAVAAGSDVLVAGSAVFRGGRVKDNVKALRQSISSIR